MERGPLRKRTCKNPKAVRGRERRRWSELELKRTTRASVGRRTDVEEDGLSRVESETWRRGSNVSFADDQDLRLPRSLARTLDDEWPKNVGDGGSSVDAEGQDEEQPGDGRVKSFSGLRKLEGSVGDSGLMKSRRKGQLALGKNRRHQKQTDLVISQSLYSPRPLLRRQESSFGGRVVQFPENQGTGKNSGDSDDEEEDLVNVKL